MDAKDHGIVLRYGDGPGKCDMLGARGKEQKDRFTKTNIKIRDDWNLRSSALLGPVEVKSD